MAVADFDKVPRPPATSHCTYRCLMAFLLLLFLMYKGMMQKSDPQLKAKSTLCYELYPELEESCVSKECIYTTLFFLELMHVKGRLKEMGLEVLKTVDLH